MTSSAIGSLSPRRSADSSPGWWAWAPRVVAEGLRPITDPLAGLLQPGPAAEPATVARALAATLAPPRALDLPPPWLDVAQGDAFRILLHAVRTHGAALSAEPVGSGKTFLALAVAQAVCNEPAVCFVPAPLVAQWEATARRLGVPALVWSHARLSLGRLPTSNSQCVIVDESHHFRHPGIRRYRTLAPWIVGRRVILLSATPVVNRADDLYHQLHLGVRDDALAHDGTDSLRVAFGGREVPAALGRFVIQRLDHAVAPIGRHREEVSDSGATSCLPALDMLALSTSPEIAALVRTVLLHAAASSPAALHAALRRYRLLLLHAQDSLAAGRPPNRQGLRQMIGIADAQMVLWSLLSEIPAEGELRLDDLPALDALLAETRRVAERPDAKVTLLRRLLEDRLPSLVFVTALETITYLRAHLSDRWVAWCSGQRAGIGSTGLGRAEVLRWFRPGGADRFPPRPGQPRTLLTTDVTAEGLDLQAAGRVVHYDLPWTEVRLAQRDGRAVRRGSTREEVEIVRLLPGPAIEERLHRQAHLLRKADLPRQLGLGAAGRRRWRWRRELADGLPGPGIEGVGAVRSAREGALVGVTLERDGERVVSTIFSRDERSEWTVEAGPVERRLREAASASGCPPPPRQTIKELIGSLSPCVRDLLRAASGLRIAGVAPTPGTLRLGRRLRSLATEAAQCRDYDRLALLDRALRFCTGGHTAGEAMLIDRLSNLDVTTLHAELARLPDPSPVPTALQARVTGLIVFQRPRGA